ncbi:MAG TPA: hypothetical protein VGW12_13735 [Pyrinomonadaceae bacterium]|nr:hypothetical protein [Pyrinomonadaceae bacterium]
MRRRKEIALCLAVLLITLAAGCDSRGASSAGATRAATANARLADAQPASRTPQTTTPQQPAARNSMRVIHVFVALCDNVNQGIVPVPARLGNGEDPAHNLYWGAAFGVKTFFSKSRDWKLVANIPNPQPFILERVVFRHQRDAAFLVADAYRGSEIKRATLDFLEAASGSAGDTLNLKDDMSAPLNLHLAGSAHLVAYVGHDGLMDFSLPHHPQRKDDERRDAIILACASKNYFAPALRQTGATPLLWTTNLMAPEAYVLEKAVDGWLKRESGQQIRTRAAHVYHQYQRCGIKGAMNLFATGY